MSPPYAMGYYIPGYTSADEAASSPSPAIQPPKPLELDPNVLAFAGDWHGNIAWVKHIVPYLKANGVDCIIHVGDFGFQFRAEFVRSVDKVLVDNGIKLYFVDGNHDNHAKIWNAAVDQFGFHIISTNIRAIPRTKRFKVWDLTFMGLGGAVSVDKHLRKTSGDDAEWWATEEITSKQMTEATIPGPVDVMVTHDCPSGIPIPGITLEEGLKYFPYHELMNAERHRDLLREIVRRVNPKFLVHGHYHVAHSYHDTYSHLKVVGLDMDGTSGNCLLVKGPLDLIGHCV